jgi:hypothetical protein
VDPQADTAAITVIARTAGAVRNADRAGSLISSPISALLPLDGGAKRLVPSMKRLVRPISRVLLAYGLHIALTDLCGSVRECRS